MTAYRKITKMQLKTLMKKNFGATVKILPSKANPYSAWFESVEANVYNTENLESLIKQTKYHLCNSELGNGVSFWIDEAENSTVRTPNEKQLLHVYRVTLEDGGYMFCMVENFAKHINTTRKKIVEGHVYAPTMTWYDDDKKRGYENNYFFTDDTFADMQFIKK